MTLPIAQALMLRANGMPRTLKEFEQSIRLLGVLRHLGFQNSVRRQMPLDGNGNAIPWWTYAANEWIKARIRASDRVFEYGCGSSTLWLAQRAKSVVAVEHDRKWYDKVSALLPPNAKVIYRPALSEESADTLAQYAAAILENDPPFDIIVIDGMERNACASLAASALSEKGIIIFDNSHRAKYRLGIEDLAKAGLWRIDMAGCVTDLSATSIFIRSPDRWLDSSIVPKDYGT